MTIAVTGATGQLGRLVIEALLERGQPADQLVATGRDVAKLDDLAARGVDVRRADLADPDGIREAFAGVERLLLISTTTVGERFDNHRRAIDAAVQQGVTRIVYTSTVNASRAAMILATEHLATEKYLADKGVPHTILRNGWYLENYTSQLATILTTGSVVGAAGEGRVNAASRRDYAEAAAVALTEDGHDGATYELGGDESFTLGELAREIAAQSGTDVSYASMSELELVALLTHVGLSGELATVLADADTGLKNGELWTDSADLTRLIGRPTTSLREAVRDSLR